MKARFFAIAALVLGLASCQQDFAPDTQPSGGEVSVQLVVSAPELIGATRAGEDGEIDGNKGTFGRVLIIAGSMKMIGCCELAVAGAFRCGAGLVTLAFPDCIYVPLSSRLTENTFMPLPCKDGKLSIECLAS